MRGYIITWEVEILTNGIKTNVPRLVSKNSDSEQFTSLDDFALNILEWVLRERGYKGAKVACFKGQCFRKAWDLHQTFKEEYLVNAPDKGEIMFFEVLSFIYGAPKPE